MPRKKKVETPEEVVEAPEVKPSKTCKKAEVLSGAGQLTRVYTEEIHGKDFEKCASSYAKKIGGSVR